MCMRAPDSSRPKPHNGAENSHGPERVFLASGPRRFHGVGVNAAFDAMMRAIFEDRPAELDAAQFIFLRQNQLNFTGFREIICFACLADSALSILLMLSFS